MFHYICVSAFNALVGGREKLLMNAKISLYLIVITRQENEFTFPDKEKSASLSNYINSKFQQLLNIAIYEKIMTHEMMKLQQISFLQHIANL